MRVSGAVREAVQKKAMLVMVFLKRMLNRDADQSHFYKAGQYASDLAAEVGELFGSSKSTVYRAYKEWKEGEMFEANDYGPRRPGSFRNPTTGIHERSFLLNHEDLKMTFKKWMRKNLRKLTVKLAWQYLNTTLLKQVDDATLRSHNICLPVCSDTAHNWMIKCKAGRCDTKKIYYNDQHQKKEVIEHRELYIETLCRLDRRMRVWVILSKDEEEEYLKCREKSPFPTAMPLGEEVVINSIPKYVHHMDNQGGWEDNPVLHPLFQPGPKPPEEDWKCSIGHSYDLCDCHLELREYGQDESIYRSGDHPSSRWGIDGRSYAISKSQGISNMVSGFKDYSKRGLGIAMSTEELKEVNLSRVGNAYADTTPMLPLLESPGLRIIDPIKAGDGYWNYEKMATQTEDVMHSLKILEPNIQQLHQFDWSSGHKKNKEGGLALSSMNFGFGGKGGLTLRDTELCDESVGPDDVTVMMYESVAEGSLSVWSLMMPLPKEGVIVKEHDCRLRAGDTQSMSFAAEEDHPPPPFYTLNAPLSDHPDLDENNKQRTTKVGKLKTILGYAGKAKGVKQVLWERGLWKPGMRAKLSSDHSEYPEMSAYDVLGNCRDFREEIGAMQDLVQSYGNIVLFSPKGHPEIAGAGIEFDWGVSKKCFRRDNNHVAKNCENDVRLSLDKVTLQIAKNTARKARSYMHAYKNDSCGSHLLIEKFVKIHKCHRNILDQDTAFLEKIVVKIEQHAADVREERSSLAAEMKEKEVKT